MGAKTVKSKTEFFLFQCMRNCKQNVMCFVPYFVSLCVCSYNWSWTNAVIWYMLEI